MNDRISLKPTKEGKESKIVTKRSTLKEIASLFDPLGLFSPILIQGNMILQKLWIKQMNCDDIILDEEFMKWETIQPDLLQIANIKCSWMYSIRYGSWKNSVYAFVFL